jgi:hypothetical protein
MKFLKDMTKKHATKPLLLGVKSQKVKSMVPQAIIIIMKSLPLLMVMIQKEDPRSLVIKDIS